MYKSVFKNEDNERQEGRGNEAASNGAYTE